MEKVSMSRQQRRLEAQKQILSHFEQQLPAFTDIFDERTFYISFTCLVIVCVILAVVLSYCCNMVITDADEIERVREKRKRVKQMKLAEKLLRKRIDKLTKAGADSTKENLELIKLAKKIEETEKKTDSEAELLEDKDE